MCAMQRTMKREAGISTKRSVTNAMINQQHRNVDVLLCSYGGGHVTMLAPVAKQLRAQGLTVEFFALTTAQSYLDRLQEPYFGYADLPEANDPDSIAAGERLASSIADGPVSRAETIAYLGINYIELVKAFGSQKADELYQANGRQAFQPARLMREIIDRVAPRLVVTTNSPRTERALLEAAHDAGIASLALVDMFGMHEAAWLGNPNSATRVGVLSEPIRQFYIKSGCRPEQVIVTGNPAFDQVNAPETISAARKWRLANQIPVDDKVIFWASQPEPERHPFTGVRGDPDLPRRIETKLREIVAAHFNWHLVVRYHPSETVAFVPQDRVIFSPVNEPFHPLLHAVDCTVIMSSTVGLEAYTAGTPIVAVELSIISPDSPYGALGMAQSVKDLDQLEAALKHSVNIPRRQQHATDANACHRVTRLAVSLLD